MATELEMFLKEMGLSMKTKFVPFSVSRNKNQKYPSLNWKVTILYHDRVILEDIDYMAGSGHCPAYKNNKYRGYDKEKIIEKECETGFECFYFYSLEHIQENKKKPILPSFTDVIYSLLSDSEVIDYTFEDWCANFGYEEDSRSAEKLYNECLQIAIQLRAGIGETNINLLREAFQDY